MIDEIIIEKARCNMKCRYCFGDYAGNANCHDKAVPFNRTFFEEHFPRETFRQKDLLIWGGEPFYNFDILKNIVDYFSPCVETFHMSSNGTMFDEEKALWCAKNRVSLQFSHDGSAQSVRGADFIQTDKWQKAVRLYLEQTPLKKSIHFHSVLHKESGTFSDYINYWEHMTDQALQGINYTLSLSAFRDATVQALPFEWEPEALVAWVHDALSYCVSGGRLHRLFMNQLCRKYVLPWVYHTGLKKIEPDKAQCGIMRRIIGTGKMTCYGTSGAPYICHAHCERVSGKEEAQKAVDVLKRCKFCMHKNYCFGSCSGIANDAVSLNCNKWHTFYTKLIDMETDFFSSHTDEELSEFWQMLKVKQSNETSSVLRLEDVHIAGDIQELRIV